MLPATIQNYSARIGKSQGYKGLAVRRDSFDGHIGMTSAWEPTQDEIARLIAGAKIYVSFLGETIPPGAQPPMIVRVGDPTSEVS